MCTEYVILAQNLYSPGASQRQLFVCFSRRPSMTPFSRRLPLFAFAAAMVLLAGVQVAQAGILQIALNQPQPTAPAPVPAPEAPMAASPSLSSGICCPQPCIEYRHCGRAVSCCQPPVQTALMVKDPCSCCEIPIPVCLPACCLDARASVDCRHGLFARGIVTYDYACGVSVTVRFKLSGEILVTYRGARSAAAEKKAKPRARRVFSRRAFSMPVGL